jgi:NTE family protein
MRTLLVVLITALAAPPRLLAHASDSPQDMQACSRHRPRVGLVLAGGGAKVGAHVGVLKVLEEMHVPSTA